MSEKQIKAEPEHLSRQEIENRAGIMLDYLFPSKRGNITNKSYPPDLPKIVQELHSRYRVQFSFAENLGNVGDVKILGQFTINPNHIRVCSSLEEWSPEFCKTLAHEIGHLILHRKLLGSGKYISKDKPHIDTKHQLRYREAAERSDLGWVEWQANEFAMCLILPRRYMQFLVSTIQHEIGIVRNLGTIYFDDQECNQRDAKTIVARISEYSGAKIDLIWNRLRFLGILEDHRKQSVKSIFKKFDVLFDMDEN